MSPYKSRHRSRPLLDASLHPISHTHINACQNPIIGHQRLEQRTRGPSEHGLPCECARRALRRGRPERRRLVRGCVPRLPLFRSCSAANLLRCCYPWSCCCRRRGACRPHATAATRAGRHVRSGRWDTAFRGACKVSPHRHAQQNLNLKAPRWRRSDGVRCGLG